LQHSNVYQVGDYEIQILVPGFSFSVAAAVVVVDVYQSKGSLFVVFRVCCLGGKSLTLSRI